MEILFENQFEHTKEYYKEFFSYSFFKTSNAVAGYIFSSILFVFCIISFFVPEISYGKIFTITCFIIPIIVWTTIIIRYFYGVSSRYNQMLEMNNGKISGTNMAISDDGIDARRIGYSETIHMSYGKIKKIVKTKSFYILLTKANVGCVFKKDGFIKGDLDGFLSYLRNKGFKC